MGHAHIVLCTAKSVKIKSVLSASLGIKYLKMVIVSDFAQMDVYNVIKRTLAYVMNVILVMGSMWMEHVFHAIRNVWELVMPVTQVFVYIFHLDMILYLANQ